MLSNKSLGFWCKTGSFFFCKEIPFSKFPARLFNKWNTLPCQCWFLSHFCVRLFNKRELKVAHVHQEILSDPLPSSVTFPGGGLVQSCALFFKVVRWKFHILEFKALSLACWTPSLWSRPKDHLLEAWDREPGNSVIRKILQNKGVCFFPLFCGCFITADITYCGLSLAVRAYHFSVQAALLLPRNRPVFLSSVELNSSCNFPWDTNPCSRTVRFVRPSYAKDQFPDEILPAVIIEHWSSQTRGGRFNDVILKLGWECCLSPNLFRSALSSTEFWM